MSNKRQYWAEIIERYKASDLSKTQFCKQSEIPLNQFQYRWHQYNLSLKEIVCAGTLTNQPSQNSFEPIKITFPPIAAKQVTNVVKLAIHLPNLIRCDVKVDLCANEFSTLLKQLVALC